MVDCSRQAGADEIEITEAMIRAGVAALWDFGDASKETQAREVFRAMSGGRLPASKELSRIAGTRALRSH